VPILPSRLPYERRNRRHNHGADNEKRD
jgi:hypothetical protein